MAADSPITKAIATKRPANATQRLPAASSSQQSAIFYLRLDPETPPTKLNRDFYHLHLARTTATSTYETFDTLIRQ